MRPLTDDASSSTPPPHWLDEVVAECDEPVGQRLEAALAKAAATAEVVGAGRGAAAAVAAAASPRSSSASSDSDDGPPTITGAGGLGGSEAGEGVRTVSRRAARRRAFSAKPA
jgi:phage-related minor tail protein